MVIVLAQRVSRDPAWSSSRGPVACVSLKIIYCKSNYRSRTRQNLLRIAPLFLATLHVIHFTVRAVAQPFTKVVSVRRGVAGGYATGIKPDVFRKRNKPRLKFCFRNHDALVEIGDFGLRFILLSLARIAIATSSSVSTDVSTRISAM